MATFFPYAPRTFGIIYGITALQFRFLEKELNEYWHRSIGVLKNLLLLRVCKKYKYKSYICSRYKRKMKQSLKFGLLLVLALLIHCVTNGTMEDICKVTSRLIGRRSATYPKTVRFIMRLSVFIIYTPPNRAIWAIRTSPMFRQTRACYYWSPISANITNCKVRLTHFRFTLPTTFMILLPIIYMV